MTRLRQHAAALAPEPLEIFCDELLTGLATDHADDVAVPVARLTERSRRAVAEA